MQEWKKVAQFWKFTDEQMKAIEEQWTGKYEYTEWKNYTIFRFWAIGNFR